jgi:single-strand DNA-binding protein
VSYQKVIIVGNLGGDPEMRYTPTGQPVTNFSVATNRVYTDKEGQQVKETTWFRVEAWRKLAETCNQYLSKGRQVLVVGHLRPDPQTGRPRIWTGNDGVARASFDLVAQEVKFLGGGAGAATGRGEPPTEEIEEPLDTEEIPF